MDWLDPKTFTKCQLPSFTFCILLLLFISPNGSLIIANSQLSTHIWEVISYSFLMYCQKNPILTKWMFYQGFQLIFKFLSQRLLQSADLMEFLEVLSPLRAPSFCRPCSQHADLQALTLPQFLPSVWYLAQMSGVLTQHLTTSLENQTPIS